MTGPTDVHDPAESATPAATPQADIDLIGKVFRNGTRGARFRVVDVAANGRLVVEPVGDATRYGYASASWVRPMIVPEAAE